MQVVILGSGSPLPSADRAGPSTLVRTSAGDLLVDAGRGVLLRASAVLSGATAFTRVFLTHLHSDHTTDLNDVITTRWAMSFVPTPLTVVGPVGTQALVAATEAMLQTDIGYRLAHHDDLDWRPDTVASDVDADGGVVFEQGDVRVIAAPTDHAPVHPTLGYRVEDGGRSVVIAGDTVPCPGLDRLAAGADALVHTVVRRDQIEALAVPRLVDVLDYHSAVGEAAATAARAGVSTLVLTHMVPPVQPGGEQGWIDQARADSTARSSWPRTSPPSSSPRVLARLRRRGATMSSDPAGPGAGRTESDPDVRFTYANERTFLAWNRTALALIATGVAATQLLPEFHIAGGRRILGVPLIALGAVIALTSFRQWKANERAMRRGLPLRPHP